MPFRIRSASSDDATAMALVHVGSWRETYRGVVRDEVLDDPAMLERRIAFWRRTLAGPARAESRVAVAESDGRIRGIAMAGPGTPQQLHLLYALRELHGTGAGGALLEAVLAPGPAELWVAERNPRARAFYAKHGFAADGVSRGDETIEIRLAR